MIDVVEAIRSFNAGREAERLAMKYRNLSTGSFVFLRGTCHLFYDRMAPERSFLRAPRVWSCGDLHLQNFGSLQGDDALVYFDINDFDEAALAPAACDLVRLLTSVLVPDGLHATPEQALGLCTALVEAYCDALASGKAGSIESTTAQGLIGRLFDKLKRRSRVEFLDNRTKPGLRGRMIDCDGRRALAASGADRERVAAIIGNFARAQPDPAPFAVHDVARRIAGTGALGVDRYVVLVEGQGSPDGNELLDLKRATPSTLASHLTSAQPEWPSQAHRVVALQRRLQAVPAALLHPLVDGDASYVLRGLHPSEDRVDLDARKETAEQITGVLQAMGRILAWAQLRGSGWQGSADARELIDFGNSRATWQQEIVQAARDGATQVSADWQTYCTAYAEGAFSTP